MDAKSLLTSHNKFHITLGLERIEKILNLLDNPQERYKIIHLAGTNGKGSTSKIINEILIEHFKKTDKKIGLYTSPHLFSYEERIKIDNKNIPPETFDSLIKEVDKLALDNNIELSEFELLTAVAFYYFYIKKAEYVILETGLGGKFDATSIIKNPIIEIITAIDFDHKERLGKTIEEIALQKAGIIKDNSKAVISKDNKGLDIIQKVASNKNAQIILSEKIETFFENDKNYALLNNKKIEFNLIGKHQGENLSLALNAIKNINLNIQENTIQKALKKVSWNFRLEYIKDKNLLIDGAHNPSGITVLRNFLNENFENSKKTFIFGCLKNKEYEKMLDILIKKEDEFYFFEFDYPNALKYEELPKKYNAKSVKTIEEIKTIINNNKNLKIFCGSLYMLGNIFKEIKI